MKNYKILYSIVLIFISLVAQSQSNSSIKPVINAYMGLKDALVASNIEQAAVNANSLVKALEVVKANNLNTSTYEIWLKIANDLNTSSSSIALSNNIKIQREYFITLSTKMYTLIKEAKYDVPVYYQFCPMANMGKGANWLSLENKVKNPYYGSMMLSCGKVVETL